MHWLYFPTLDRAAVAGLAPLVIQAAEADDSIAQNIVKKGARELAVMVKAVAEKLNMRAAEIKISTAGGLVNEAAYYRRAFQATLGEMLPEALLINPFLPPVIGAALLGYRQAKGIISPEILAKLNCQQKLLD